MGMFAGARLRLGAWLMRLGLRVAGDEVVEEVFEVTESADPQALDAHLPFAPVEIGERGREMIAGGLAARPGLGAVGEKVPEPPLEGSLEERRLRAGVRR